MKSRIIYDKLEYMIYQIHILNLNMHLYEYKYNVS